MTIAQAILLGVLQGLTEFLPVSSSGHLFVAESLLQGSLPPEELLGFDVLLHAGSLLALLLCYVHRWRDMLLSVVRRDAPSRRLLLLLALATVPGVLAGLFLEGAIAAYGRSLPVVGFAFLVTAMVLLTMERMPQSRGITALRMRDACFIGCAQACALLPGLSRSGLTIAAGRMVGMHRRDAVEFSFLMALPIITGATLVTLLHLTQGSLVLPSPAATAAGMVASLVSSVLAIVVLRRMAVRYSFAPFAFYLFILGGLILLRTSGRMDALTAPALP